MKKHTGSSKYSEKEEYEVSSSNQEIFISSGKTFRREKLHFHLSLSFAYKFVSCKEKAKESDYHSTRKMNEVHKIYELHPLIKESFLAANID